jgi:hypothetical protein
MPLNKFMFLRKPLPMFLVSFDGFSILLPSLNLASDIYSILPSIWEKGQRVILEAHVLLRSWPDRLQMKLEYS